jgi:hypothetical protein
MTKIQNLKQKNNRFEPVWNLAFGIYDLFVIWCLEFVISDTKFQGRAIYL